MAENVNRNRSESLTLIKGTEHKNEVVEATVDDDMTIGAIKDEIVRKLAGGRYKGEISTAQTSQSAGGVQIDRGELHVATYSNCTLKGEHSVAKKRKSDLFKIIMEEEVANTKAVMENEENIGTPIKRKRGADGEIVLAYMSSQERSSPRLRPRKKPSFRMVDLDEGDGGRIVGKRIKVYWPDSRKWFIGHIKAFDDKKRLHSILYDDGDKEELDLRKERFQLEIMPAEAFSLKAESSSKEKAGGLGGHKVGTITLLKETCEAGDAKEAVNGKKNTSKKVGKRGNSRLQKNGTEVKDLVTSMDSNVLPCSRNKVIADENCAAEEPVKQNFDKEHDECKSLAEIVREAAENLEAQAMQPGRNSEFKSMGSCSNDGEASNLIESDDSISVVYAKLVKRFVSLKKNKPRTSNMNSSKLLSRRENDKVEKLDTSMKVHVRRNDEVKKSTGHGDIIANEAEEEVNDHTENHKMRAHQEVGEENGGVSCEDPATSPNYCAVVAIADTINKAKQEQTENINASEDAVLTSLVSAHDTKGYMEDVPPNIEVPAPTDVLTVEINSNRKSVLKAAGEEACAVSVNLQPTKTKNPERENPDTLQEKLKIWNVELDEDVTRKEAKRVSQKTAEDRMAAINYTAKI